MVSANPDGGAMNLRRFVLIAVPYLWLLALFLVPFLIVLKISLSDIALADPALHAAARPLRRLGRHHGSSSAALDFENFAFLTTDDLYWKAYLSSLWIALVSTVVDAAGRLSDRLWHGPRARGMAPDADDAGDPAVLDLLPDPRLCLDGHPVGRRRAEPVPALDGR